MSGISTGKDTKPGPNPLHNQEDPRIEAVPSASPIYPGPGSKPTGLDEAERGTGR